MSRDPTLGTTSNGAANTGRAPREGAVFMEPCRHQPVIPSAAVMSMCFTPKLSRKVTIPQATMHHQLVMVLKKLTPGQQGFELASPLTDGLFFNQTRIKNTASQDVKPRYLEGRLFDYVGSVGLECARIWEHTGDLEPIPHVDRGMTVSILPLTKDKIDYCDSNIK